MNIEALHIYENSDGERRRVQAIRDGRVFYRQWRPIMQQQHDAGWGWDSVYAMSLESFERWASFEYTPSGVPL